ncbi:S8 family serine peptidase [Cellulomonas sp. Leaf334]|uniref:S8 family serine peptidase n=1 Tax=Cellulomonas sp. Leaf334 TaxID=1736339 RepID=UPI0006FEED00|nr:S8 family serine peptidase [Cellulomonas sp. Leaf334]KQR16680.1 hypothetical protein ASF78_04780 [Cellulomonas sp. Leaf334]
MKSVRSTTRRARRARTVLGGTLAAFLLATSLVPTAAGAVPRGEDPTGSEPSARTEIPRVPETGNAAPEPDQVLVRFVDGVADAQERSALSAAGVTEHDTVGATGFVAVAVGDQDPEQVAADLADDPRVADVQVDHVRSAAVWPDDTLVQSSTWPYLDLTRFPRAWDVTRGAGATVAVLDTGVRSTHQDFAGGRVLTASGYDFVDDDTDASDQQGHGTLVAGIAAARGNDGFGVAGAAWDAKILPVRVLDDEGFGNDSDLAAGITWAVDKGATVINLSLTGPEPAPAILAALQYAVGKKVVVVAAAGNQGTEAPLYPAAYAAQVPGVLSVAATDDWGTRAGFSSWGDTVSLAAPGVDIVGPSSLGDAQFVVGTGTSMASPLVAGAAAMLRQAKPGWTAAQVADALVASARDAGSRGRDPYLGAGVLDVSAAFGQTRGVPLDRATGAEGDSDDDVPARAHPLPTTEPAGNWNGVIDVDGDADWWSVPVSGAGWREITLTASTNADVEVDVVDASYRRLGTARTGQYGGTKSTTVPVAAAGTVYLRVRGVAAATGGSYRLDVRAGTELGLNPELVRDDVSATSSQVAVGDLVPGGALDGVVASTDGSTGVLSVVTGVPTTLRAEVVVPEALVDNTLVLADVLPGGGDEVVAATPSGVRAWPWSAGTLGAATLLSADVATAVRATDVDGDGDDDLVLTTAASTVLLRHDGSALVPVTLLAGPVVRLAVGDVTGDGRPDLVGAGPAGAASIEVVPQAPAGTFGASSLVPTREAPAFVDVADVDGDGDGDVLAIGVDGTSNSVTFHAQGADHTLGAATSTFTGYVSRNAAVLDVDADGLPDILSGRGSSVTWVRRTGPGTFGARTNVSQIGTASDTGARGLAVGDLSGDGRGDVLVASAGGTINVLRNRYLAEPPGGAEWIVDGPQTQRSGVPVRPTLTVVSGRQLPAGAATTSTVRLVDGTTGSAVAATRTVDPATDTIRITPSADLVVGRHYQLRVAGLTDADGAVQDEAYRTYFTVGASGDRFTPLEPVRVLDTRDGTGVEPGRVVPGEPIDLQLGGWEVPDTATAVVLNVTAVSPSGLGNVRVFPTPASGDAVPTVSNLNLAQWADQPNLVTVKLGAEGSVRFAIQGATADLVADIAGYYSEGGGTAYTPVSPVRVMNLMDGTGGVPTGRLRYDHYVDLQVAGVNGVPADATAVVLNVTGVAPGGMTNVRVYPRPAASEPQEPPAVSNLNLTGGRDQPNLVTVLVGDGGKVRFYTQSHDLWLIADLAGYYSPTGRQGFTPVDPSRIADTRSGVGLSSTLRAGVTSQLKVTGVGGVPSGATAVVLNVTAASPRGTTNIRVFPTVVGGPVPTVSNLNVVRGRDEPNLVMVPVGANGSVSFYSQSFDTDLVVDVQGFFTQ